MLANAFEEKDSGFLDMAVRLIRFDRIFNQPVGGWKLKKVFNTLNLITLDVNRAGHKDTGHFMDLIAVGAGIYHRRHNSAS